MALVCFAYGATAQVDMDRNLAREFIESGDYDKAAVIYERLLAREPDAFDLYKPYFKTLLALEDFEKLEKFVKKKIKRDPNRLTYMVDLGFVYHKKGALSKAQQEYDRTIKNLKPNRSIVKQVANRFVEINEFDHAIRTLEKGQDLMGSPFEFIFDLANVHARKGDIASMMRTYLDYLELHQKNDNMIRNLLQRAVATREYRVELQAQLYKKIQKKPDEIVFPEMLIWSFIQANDFRNALIQSKALDKRFKENGKRVLDLARIAHREKDFETAILAYEYVLQSRSANLYELTASIELLNCRKDQITYTNEYSEEALQKLVAQYEGLIVRFGKNMNTAHLLEGYAELQARYLHDLDKAIEILEDLVGMRGLQRKLMGKAKLKLGDFYLMRGENWEATLLYSQVDKAFKDDPLGEEGRFKNAKLSYYMGDFEWSQAQLEVLQSATSELIANDAIDLFVFIQDHLALDTIATPMMMFADADLLAFQNKNVAAFQAFEDLKLKYPGHSLTDDVLIAQSKIRTQERNYVEAAELLTQIIDYYPEEVLADDAIFHLADLYENRLNKKNEAQELYQAIILEHSGSTWVIEARKRFRKLRGDKIN
jgi:tetratricopeptide (TPR) repeat protein